MSALAFFVFTVIGGFAFANEGGHEAIQDHGFKGAIVQAWDEREPYDTLLPKSKTGNFGND